MTWPGATDAPPDPKRWIALFVLSMSLFIIVLDNTIVNVAVPTIVRELHTSVSALQWVISGYALAFASLLISFGRVGDVIGRRKLFFIGALLFAGGSAFASVSHSALQLFIGESLIEGVGAAMMLPATLAIISATFQGRERGLAFAVWGAVAGGAGALGPYIGGILTSDYSWRWAFRVNVIIAPAAVLAAVFVVRESKDDRGGGIDIPGLIVVTLGLLGVVFGIIEAARYGALTAITSTRLLGLSPVPWSILAGASFLAFFVVLEDARAEQVKPVIFDFRDLVHRGFRYGLINTLVLAMGEFGAFFILPIFMQASLHLSAIRTGTWLLPAGACAFGGGWVGGLLSRKYGPKYVITVGLFLEAAGIVGYAVAFGPHTTFLSLLPALVLHGIGIGFATSQLTNVVLSDIPPQKAGSASGAAGMVRQVGTSLGIAVIGAILLSQAGSHIRHDLKSVPGLPPQAQASIVDNVSNFDAASTRAGANPEIGRIVSRGIADGSVPAAGFAAAVVFIGALLSTLVPNIPPDAHPGQLAQPAAAH
ncbi:MAG TPA: MFS transporter [Acidimicrobiales bacterium]|nr:MFS transporter [Acidimicrobiales bacterium]